MACAGKCSDRIPYTACNTFGVGTRANSLCLPCNRPGLTCCDGYHCGGGLTCNTYTNKCEAPSYHHP